jgi:antitoxin (DNA-binding transcriptional repressor) of toxin-antitoxin stability system
MKTIDILQAEQDLFELVDEAAKGKTFVISIDGKPLVRVEPLQEPDLVAYHQAMARLNAEDKDVE